MKLVYALDHHFIPCEAETYSESQFPSSWWRRYLKHFDAVVVLCRQTSLPPDSDTTKLQLSSHKNVVFAYGPNLSSPIAQLTRKKYAISIANELLKDADALIVRLPSQLGLAAVSVACKKGIPWAVELAGCPWDGLWHYGNWKAKLYAPVMTIRTRLVVRRAPFVLYVTNKFLQQRYPNANGLTVACSNVEIPAPSPEILDKRQTRISQQKKPIVFGLIGTLKTRYKGIQTVMEALSLARHALPSVQFRILGEGDKAPWIEEAKHFMVDDIVFFDGTLAAGEPVLEWLDNIDVYLQPSFKEGLPRALIEAMSRGCPAIASTCAGIPELLDNICLIKPGDAKKLAPILIRAANDIQWQNSQSHRNWLEACHYSRDKLETRRNAFYSHFADIAKKNADTRKK